MVQQIITLIEPLVPLRDDAGGERGAIERDARQKHGDAHKTHVPSHRTQDEEDEIDQGVTATGPRLTGPQRFPAEFADSDNEGDDPWTEADPWSKATTKQRTHALHAWVCAPAR